MNNRAKQLDGPNQFTAATQLIRRLYREAEIDSGKPSCLIQWVLKCEEAGQTGKIQFTF